MTDPTSPGPAETELRPPGEFLLIMFRAFVGYMILFFCFMMMVKRTPWQLSVLDAVYWLVVAVLLLLRLCDKQPGSGRYALLLGGGSLLLWLGANTVQMIS